MIIMFSINPRSQINHDYTNAFCSPTAVTPTKDDTLLPATCDVTLAERIIRYLGCVSIIMCGLQLYRYIESNGMLEVMLNRVTHRNNWSILRQATWMFTKTNGRTGERVPNPWGVMAILSKTKFTGYKVYWEAFKTVRKQPYVVYLIVLFVTNWIALSGNRAMWLYSIHMVDLAVCSKSVRNTVFPALTYLWNVVMLVFSTFAIMFIFAVIIWRFAPEMLQSVQLQGATSDSFDGLADTVMFVMNYGFRMGGGIGDVLVPYFAHDSSEKTHIGFGDTVMDADGHVVYSTAIPYRWFHWVTEMVFMLCIVIFFMNIILVVMVDGVAEYKDKKAVQEQEMSTNCTVCSLDRDTLDGAGNGFGVHLTREHDLFSYLDLVQSLVDRQFDEFNGTETAVSQCLLDGEWTFVPFNNTLQLQHMEDETSSAEGAGVAGGEAQQLRDMVGVLTSIVSNQSAAIAQQTNSIQQMQAQLARLLGEGGLMSTDALLSAVRDI